MIDLLAAIALSLPAGTPPAPPAIHQAPTEHRLAAAAPSRPKMNPTAGGSGRLYGPALSGGDAVRQPRHSWQKFAGAAILGTCLGLLASRIDDRRAARPLPAPAPEPPDCGDGDHHHPPGGHGGWHR